MKISHKIHTEETLVEGATYWVCDYRFSEVRKYVPTRHVKPTEVTCVVNNWRRKEFKTKKGKNIPIWSNVRFSESLYIFDTKEECVSQYNSLVENNAAQLKHHIEYLQAERNKMLKHLILK